MVVQLLTRAVDRVLLRVEQVLHEQDQLDLLPLIDAIARPVLRGAEEAKLAFPVSEHVRLEAGELAHLADGEELLHRVGGAAHTSCSGRSSRAISSCAARLAGW